MVGIAILFDVASRRIKRLATCIERVGFEPGGGEAFAGDRGFGEIHQRGADAGAGMGGMDVERVHEIILPVDKAHDGTRAGGNVEDMAAHGDIGSGAAALPVGRDGGGRDLGAPCGVERVVQYGDESGSVCGERGAELERLRLWATVRETGVAGNGAYRCVEPPVCGLEADFVERVRPTPT